MNTGDKTVIGERVTIYPRGKKRLYVADFWQGGDHRKVSLKTANKKVATARATVLAAELLQGTFRQAAPPVDVQQTADAYVASLKTNGRARKTLVKYEGIFRIFVAFLLMLRIGKLHQITGTHFDAWRAHRRSTRAPKTVYTESVVVKQLFRWARSRKLIADDPLAGIALAKPVTQPKGGPSFEQLNALLAAADAELASGRVPAPRRKRGPPGKYRCTRGCGRSWKRWPPTPTAGSSRRRRAANIRTAATGSAPSASTTGSSGCSNGWACRPAARRVS